jgi:hypothetical protein
LSRDRGPLDDRAQEYPKGAYSELEYLLLRLELLCETDPRANLKYPTQVRSAHLLLLFVVARLLTRLEAPLKKPADVKKSPAQSHTEPQYWAKGTGYGHQGQSTWDVNAYLAAQRAKDQQTEYVLKARRPSATRR